MAISDQSLVIAVTADTAEAQAQFNAMEQRLAALEAAYNKSSDAGKVAALTTGEVASVSGDAARAFNALGLGAEGAASRVSAFAGAMDGLKSAMGPMALVIAGSVAAMRGFDFLRDGVSAASDLQHSLETLRATVEGQGGSWNALQASVQKFIDTESIAAGMTRNDIASALNMAAAAMGNVADAERLVGVAEEVAIGQHKSLAEVTDELIHAEAGRAIGLAANDTALKSLIQSHAHLGAILNELHDRYQKQLALTDDNTMAWNREHVAMGQVGEEVGSVMLPMMTDFAYGMLRLKQIVVDFGNAFVESWRGVGEAVESFLVQILAPAAVAFDDFFHMRFGSIGKDVGAAIQGAAIDSKLLANAAGKDLSQAFTDGFSAMTNASSIQVAQSMVGALSQHHKSVGVFDPNWGPEVGMSRHGGARAGAGRSSAGSDAKQAKDDIQQLTDAYKAGAITLTEYDNALNKIGESHRKNIGIIHEVVTAEADASNKILSTAKQNEAAVTRAAEEEQKRQFDALKQHLDAQVQLRNITSVQEVDILKKFTETHKALAQSQADAEKKAIFDVRDADENEKVAAIERRVRLKEETIAAAIAELQAEAAHYKAIGDAGASEYARIMQAVDSLKDDQIAAGKEAHTKMHDQAQKYADEVVKFFENIGKSGKSVFQDLENAFAKMIEDMIAKFAESKLANMFMGFMGQNAGPIGVGSALGAAMGPFGFDLLDAPGTTQTPAGNALNVNVAGVHPGLLSALTTSSGAASVGGILAIAGGAAGIGSMLSGLEGGGSHQAWGALGSIAGVAGVGILGSLLGGGSILGSLGATLAMGPAGWATLGIAAIGGGLLGGLFGNKGPNPTDNPDQAGNPQAYGQFVTNMNADPNGTFGNLHISAQSQYATVSEAAQIFNELNGPLPAAVSQLASQLKSLENGDTNPNALSIASESQGVFTLSSGAKISVSDYMNLVNQFQSQVNPNGTSAVPAFSITRLYPDYNIANINGGVPGAGGVSDLPGTIQQPITVNIDARGSLGLNTDDIILKISQGLNKLNKGTSFGGYRTPVARATGGF